MTSISLGLRVLKYEYLSPNVVFCPHVLLEYRYSISSISGVERSRSRSMLNVNELLYNHMYHTSADLETSLPNCHC